MISRRRFIISAAKSSPMLGAAGGMLASSGDIFAWARASAASPAVPDRIEELLRSAPRARYWISTATPSIRCIQCHEVSEKLPEAQHKHRENFIKCTLCAQGCALRRGERGKCRARINVQGEMRSLVYGRPVTVHIDPIEKKPFYHFLPGSAAFSLATAGCPLRCKFCQNWEISQSRPEDHDAPFIPPAEVVSSAIGGKSSVIAFTYNEPTVFAEYLTDIARLARKQNLRCVMISCGLMNPEPLKEMCDVLHAIKIDLKGFSEDFYRKVCSAELTPVLRTIKQIAKSGVHLEIVNLVVPTLNDSDIMLSGLADWAMGEIGPDVPIHFTRFHPDYQMLNLPPTPVATLERAYNIARSKGIHYAYVGNVPDHPGNHTYCPNCQKIVIRRNGFFILEQNLAGGHCRFCKQAIAGVWS